jgi:carbon-monoxide dehydrogenase iron sulfur subunit
MRRIIVEAAECAGCRVCELACSFRHEERFSPSLSRITVIKEDKHGLDYPLYCRQCESCPPESTCPTGALSRTTEGTVAVDREACIGCGSCVTACNYDAVKLDDSSRPLICDLCGGEPECVKRCPTDALRYEESDTFTETIDDAFSRLRKEWKIDG